MLKKKFKSCLKLQENIWDTSKVLKLKEIKWKFFKSKIKKTTQKLIFIIKTFI